MPATTVPLVDWAAAGAAAAALAPPGPPMTRAEIDDLVAELRECASLAVDPVAETAELEAGDDAGDVLVVDRAGWARANAASFGHLMDPVIAASLQKQKERRAAEGKSTSDGPPGLAAITRAVNAAETGSLLAFMATKVLGQYDVLAPDGGRLLLVAPNVAHVETEIGAVPSDFRLWVCLHEETHRVQFGANPWLAAWFRGQVVELLDDMLADPASTLQRLVEGLGRLPDILRAPVADRRRPRRLGQHRAHRPRADAGAEGAARRADRGHVAARGPRRRGHGRRRAVRGAHGGPDPGPVRGAARRHRPAGPDRAPPARPGRQGRAVPGRRALRPRGDRAGRHGRVQRGVVRAGDPAERGRAAGAGGVGGPGPRLSRPGGADPPGPVRDVRLAVRAAVRDLAGGTVVVGVSGGADSLALLAAAVDVAGPLRLRVSAVCVDHGWHPRTRDVAARVARAALDLGADRVRVVRVVPARGPGGGWAGGPEEAARTARLAALEAAAARDGAGAVLLGHTLDDQAEQVLLGLARGSGARALAGIPARRAPFVRPLLGLRRATVRAACPELPGLGLPWHDPSNGGVPTARPTPRRPATPVRRVRRPGEPAPGAPALLRARVRGELLPVLVDVLGEGAVVSLARSADLLREDADALDAWAAREADALAGAPARARSTCRSAPLLGLPGAVRRRVLRLLAVRAGARPLALAHTRALDALVTGPDGHGPVALPGPVTAARTTGADGCGRLTLARPAPPQDPPREDLHGRR